MCRQRLALIPYIALTALSALAVEVGGGLYHRRMPRRCIILLDAWQMGRDRQRADASWG